MLLNISYNDPTVKRQIEKAVGRPFSLQQRWKLGGIGSQKLMINSASIDIHNLLILDNNLKSCNLELRPLGIIVHFRSLLETYGLGLGDPVALSAEHGEGLDGGIASRLLCFGSLRLGPGRDCESRLRERRRCWKS